MAKRKMMIRMGEGAVTVEPNIISSPGIGSCVVVALYDIRRGVGGLAHVMLPDSSSLRSQRPPYHCADTAINTLLMKMINHGATRKDMVAKMVGGARMFAGIDGAGSSIGKENARNIRRILNRERIPLAGEDIGGSYGRSVEFRLDTGKVIVATVGRKKDLEL
jgi:chemotaxis protein CheD